MFVLIVNFRSLSAWVRPLDGVPGVRTVLDDALLSGVFGGGGGGGGSGVAAAADAVATYPSSDIDAIVGTVMKTCYSLGTKGSPTPQASCRSTLRLPAPGTDFAVALGGWYLTPACYTQIKWCTAAAAAECGVP